MLGRYPFVIISWRSFITCMGILLCLAQSIFGQQFTFNGKKTSQKIVFKLIKNLVVIPIYINGKGPYDFLLDTGVGPLIILEPKILDTLHSDKLRRIKISGLGLEQVEAFITNDIKVNIGKASAENIPAAILKEDLFNLSGYLGLNIYGIVGFNFFNSFIVDIRYSNSVLKFYSLERKIKYKGSKVPIILSAQKPYIDVSLEIDQNKKIAAHLLMDTGASHALSLETINATSFPLPYTHIPAYLGMSLSGQITGNVARVKNISIGDFTFKDVVSGFPDFKFIETRLDSNRNGNIGAEMLKKFNIQFNYQERFIYLKPNKYFKKEFDYDMVGATVYADMTTNRIYVGDVDAKSPAEESGLLADDEILAINFKPIETFSLNEIVELFKLKESKTLIIETLRNDKRTYKIVKLRKRI